MSRIKLEDLQALLKPEIAVQKLSEDVLFTVAEDGIQIFAHFLPGELKNGQAIALMPHDVHCFDTGLRLLIPKGFEGHIEIPYSYAVKSGITAIHEPLVDKIDLMVTLYRFPISMTSHLPFLVHPETPLGTLKIRPKLSPVFHVVQNVDDVEKLEPPKRPNRTYSDAVERIALDPGSFNFSPSFPVDWIAPCGGYTADDYKKAVKELTHDQKSWLYNLSDDKKRLFMTRVLSTQERSEWDIPHGSRSAEPVPYSAAFEIEKADWSE